MLFAKQPWNEVEGRQQDAGVGVTSLKIATRAAEGGFNTHDVFQNSENPIENHVRPADFQDLKLRSKVEALLRVAIIDDVEIAQFVNAFVDAQYQGSLDTLKLGKNPLYDPDHPKEGDLPAPTLAQAKEILTTQVTIEQIEVIKSMENPTLQLIPITFMGRYVDALNGYKPMDGQIDAYSSDWHKGIFGTVDNRDGVINNSIMGWRIAVTEGAKEPKLLKGDDVNKTLRERGSWFEETYQSRGVSGVDLKRMLVLMMGSLNKGAPVNDCWTQNGTWTFVNEEPEKDGYVSGVGWFDDNRQVGLYVFRAGDRYACARLRASVMVDVPRV